MRVRSRETTARGGRKTPRPIFFGSLVQVRREGWRSESGSPHPGQGQVDHMPLGAQLADAPTPGLFVGAAADK